MGMTTYHEWLRELSPDDKNLHDYLGTLTGEYWNSEFKAAEIDVDFGVRKTVAALANARGGEVFLGVRDDREAVGTEVSIDRLTQVLKQERANPGIWYLVDLNQPVRRSIRVPLGVAGKAVYVLEVAPAGLPVFVLDSQRVLNLYVRRGASSELRNGFGALEWNRQVSRESILRTCFLEFETLAQRIEPNPNLGPDLGLPTSSFGSTLPYLVRRMEDGSFYTHLTMEDRVTLLGRHNPDSSHSPGFLGRFLRLESVARRVLERMEAGGRDPYTYWPEAQQQLSSEFQMILADVDGFKRYLKSQGIVD